MTALEEITALKGKIDDLKIKRARYQERLESETRERDRLLEEAKRLGVEDPAKLGEWVAEKRKVFEKAKEKVETLLAEAE